MHSTSTPYQEIQQTMQKTTATSEHIFNKQIQKQKDNETLYIVFSYHTGRQSRYTRKKHCSLQLASGTFNTNIDRLHHAYNDRLTELNLETASNDEMLQNWPVSYTSRILNFGSVTPTPFNDQGKSKMLTVPQMCCSRCHRPYDVNADEKLRFWDGSGIS